MKDINLLVKNSTFNPDKLSAFFNVTLVDSLQDNTLIVDGDHFVDWSYIATFGLVQNYNFVFLEEYLKDGYQRDRYIDSGIKYCFKATSEFRPCPIVKYSCEVRESRPILFLDRDGILNEDTGYVYEYSDSIIFKDMIEVVKLANKLDIPVAIVTNQAGVARGMYSLSDVDIFHSKLKNFYSSHGAIIDHIEVCPFHKEHGSREWRYDSLLRKPNPGMHLKALGSLSGTITNSLMIGDKESDRVKLDGVTSIILSGNYEMDVSNDVCSTRQELCQKISKYLNNLLDLS